MMRNKKQYEQRPIPAKYLTARVVSLARQGKLSREEVRAAAMFCYYEEAHWLDWAGVGTNFPRGFKVQSSLKRSMTPHGDWSVRQPKGYDRLQWFLIERLSFEQIALRAGLAGSKRTLHRKGFLLCRHYLALFAKSLGR